MNDEWTVISSLDLVVFYLRRTTVHR